jgi:hypothetical protein
MIRRYVASLIVHDTNLAGDRLNAELSLELDVKVEPTGHRQAAWAAANQAFRDIGLGPIMDRPTARVDISVSPK